MTVTWDFCDAGCTLTGSHHGTLSAIKRRPPAQAGWKPSIEFVFVVDCGPSAGEIVTRRLPESFTRVGDLYQFLRITCGGEVPAGLAPASLLGRRFALTMVPRDDKFTRVGYMPPRWDRMHPRRRSTSRSSDDCRKYSPFSNRSNSFSKCLLQCSRLCNNLSRISMLPLKNCFDKQWKNPGTVKVHMTVPRFSGSQHEHYS